MSFDSRTARTRKEAFFIQVKDADGRPIFFDATDHLGRQMPYSKPLATCAMRVRDNMVAFSVLKLTTRSRANLASSRLIIPHGPLSRMERRVDSLETPPTADELLVEIDGEQHQYRIGRDENNVVTLHDLGDSEEEVTFELPKRALQITLVTTSAKAAVPVAVTFIGHLGKPGNSETVTRAASQALNLLTTLPAFRLVSGIETVTVPPPPARVVATRPVRKPEDAVKFRIPVRLWDDSSEPPALVSQGFIDGEVDLETANPVTARLLFHFTPDEAIADTFETYRSTLEAGVTSAMSAHFGPDEIADLVFDIALGSLDDRGIERLKDAVATIGGHDLSPRQFSPFQAD